MKNRCCHSIYGLEPMCCHAFVDADITEEKEWICAALTNPAFTFMSDSEEDIYSINEGKPIDD